MAVRLVFGALFVTLGVLSAQPASAACPTILDTAHTRAIVEGIQRELAIKGFDAKAFDGSLGPNTQAAIRAYQRKARLPVDGCPSEELLIHITFTVPPVTATPGAAVATLETDIQQALTDLGYYSGPVDGRVGPLTRRAIRAFQKDRGLPQDGRADETLYAQLRSAVSGRL